MKVDAGAVEFPDAVDERPETRIVWSCAEDNRSHGTWWMVILVMAAALLLLSACGTSSQVVEAGASASQQSELGKIIDSIGGSGLDTARDAFLRSCLTGEGIPSNQVDQILTDLDAKPAPVPAEGLGISTSVSDGIDEILADADRLVASYQDAESNAGGLSGETALQEVLYGTAGSPGCLARADTTLGAASRGFFDELGPALSKLEYEYSHDQRVVDFWAKWSSCMNQAGYEVSNMDQLAASFVDRMNQLRSQIEIRPRSLAPGDYNLSEDERQRILDGRISSDVERTLLDIQADEIAAADQSAKCGVDPSDSSIPRELVAVRLEYEQQFLEKHSTEIRHWQDESSRIVDQVGG